jgi:hypothetical protein
MSDDENKSAPPPPAPPPPPEIRSVYDSDDTGSAREEMIVDD